MSKLESSQESMRLVSYCPVCETRYNPMHAQELGGEGKSQFMHIQCRKCLNSILSLIRISDAGASSVGLLTDLSYDDVVRFRLNQSVSVNDVIDLHVFLQKTPIKSVPGRKRARVSAKTTIKSAKKKA